jgi:hypothetical protein
MHRARVPLLTLCLLAASPVHAGAPVPQFQWASQALIGTGESSAHGLVMDHSGNMFVCGTFKDTLTLSTGALRATGNTVPGNSEVFLVKYATNGTVLWARHGGNSTLGSNEAGYSVAVDPAGSSYLTGEYSGASPTSFGGIQIDDTGGGAFVVKYAQDGTVQWARSVATTGVGNSIALSGPSIAYVFVGGFPTSSVKKLNTSDGSESDSWDFTGLMPDQAMKLSVDGSGNVVISGSFVGTVDFDPGAGVSNLVGDGGGDGFIAKYSSTGTLLWVRKLTSTASDGIKNHVLSAAGDVYFAAAAGDAVTIDVVSADAGQVVGRLDADGNGLWLRNTVSNFSGFPLDVQADGIGVDGAGDYYVIGPGLAGGGDIGGYPIPIVNHFHIVRYSPAGAVVYAKFVTGGAVAPLPRAIAVFGPDLYNVVGGMVDESTFDSFVLPDVNGFPRQGLFSAQVGDVTVPVLASLATAEATPDLVRLRWYVTGLEGIAQVERRRGADEWIVLGEATRGGPDYLVYEDPDITPGEQLTYRLLWEEEGQVLRSDPVQIVVPSRIERLALAAAPNPASGFVDALISVPARGEGTLTMHDLQGREVKEHPVRAEAAGRMIVRLGTAELPAGLYWLSLRHGAERTRTRVSVVR